MTAVDNFLRQGRMFLDSLADHVRSHFDSNPIPQIEEARNPFLETVVVPFLDGQIRIFRVKRWKGTTRSSFGLGASFELHRD